MKILHNIYAKFTQNDLKTWNYFLCYLLLVDLRYSSNADNIKIDKCWLFLLKYCK